MKKIVLIGLILSVILSGCSSKAKNRGLMKSPCACEFKNGEKHV
ncbi:MAG: hypothetical protein RBR23_10000 [Arcobacteraceae bacterium]|jgi:hypothetical protein|nr:hypothetical protein [Arcobacteraceae bacterium]